jgi:hypothetical protein
MRYEPRFSTDDHEDLWNRLSRVNWKAALFDFVFLPLTGFVALNINAEAVRILAPFAARKLFSLPILRGIDSAPFIAILFLCAVFWATIDAIQVLRRGAPEDVGNPAFDSMFPIVVAVPLLIADCLFFYLGLTHQSLFRGKIQAIPLLISIAYTTATLYLAYLHIKFKESRS